MVTICPPLEMEATISLTYYPMTLTVPAGRPQWMPITSLIERYERLLEGFQLRLLTAPLPLHLRVIVYVGYVHALEAQHSFEVTIPVIEGADVVEE